MGVERSVANLFHPNLTIFDENNIPGRILADAEKIFVNVHVFVTILSPGLGFAPISNESSQAELREIFGAIWASEWLRISTR